MDARTRVCVDAWTRQQPIFFFFFLDKSRKLSKIVSVLQFASVVRFNVSRMRDFYRGTADQNHSEKQVAGEGGLVGEDNDVLEDPDHFTGQKSVIMILKTVSHQDCHTIGRAGQS